LLASKFDELNLNCIDFSLIYLGLFQKHPFKKAPHRFPLISFQNQKLLHSPPFLFLLNLIGLIPIVFYQKLNEKENVYFSVQIRYFFDDKIFFLSFISWEFLQPYLKIRQARRQKGSLSDVFSIFRRIFLKILTKT